MKSRFNKIRHVYKNNIYMLKYVFKHEKLYAIATLLFRAAFSIAHVFIDIIIGKSIFDVAQSGGDFKPVFVYIACYATFMIILTVIWQFFNASYSEKAKERLNQKMQSELFEKATKVELKCYDDPKFYTDFIWATSQADNKVLEVLATLGNLVASGTTIITLIIVFLSLDFIGLIFALSSFLATFVISILQNKLGYKREVELKPLERKRDYINRVLYLPEYAKEIRLTNVKTVLKEEFSKSNKNIISVFKKYTWKSFRFEYLKSGIFDSLLLNIVYFLILAYKAIVLKTILYGTLMALLNAMVNLKWNLVWFSNILPEFARHSLYIDNFKAFVDYEIEIQSGVIIHKETPGLLEFKNVSFAYEGNEKLILKNINLTIEPYRKIAIVGYNGAGKSTLVKLITRLYDPSCGEIFVDGKKVSDFNLCSYRNSFATVFQDFQIFAATIKENIVMDTAAEYTENLYKAIDRSGFREKLNEFPDGVDTPLLKEFDEKGMLLSGGESQKIAIARAYYKDCPYIILDEPSSALDPISEHNLNETVTKIFSEKTVIFISHRLSTTRNADKIYMFEEGEIIEEGTHDELMKFEGKYATMFNLQASKYRKKEY